MNGLDWPQNADEQDVALFERVDRDAEHDLDAATAALYRSFRLSALHGPFISQIESNRSTGLEERPALVLLPGAFHRHHAGTGADGRRLLEIAAQLGWQSTVVPVRSLGSLRDNAEALIEHLLRHDARRVVLASLSKGSADVVTALRHRRAGDAFARVCGWVSLSGMLNGTALIPWLRRQWWRTAGIHLWLWSRGLRFAPLDEIARSSGGSLSQPIVLPSHLCAIHVLGFPLRRHLRHPWAPRGYERLAPLGPNDGGGIVLEDALGWPGFVYPVWGADHYLDPAWDVSPLLRQVLLHAAQSQNTASATPAIKSTK